MYYGDEEDGVFGEEGCGYEGQKLWRRAVEDQNGERGNEETGCIGELS